MSSLSLSIKLALCLLVLFTGAFSQRVLSVPIEIPVLYLELKSERPPVLSNILPVPDDSGLRGAELGVADNNSTGRFLQQRYRMESVVTAKEQEILDAAELWLKVGHGLILAKMPEDLLLRLMALPDVKGKGIVFNVGDAADSLRRHQCLPRLLHTLPSRAMLTDALSQFLIARRWNKWLLISGSQPGDLAYTQALQRSAQRFGGDIIATKTWQFTTDLRRTAQQELPLFTQAPSYHVTLVADEIGDVGEYVLYNTWHPRPVAGTQGLRPVAWHRVVEQWGAAQLQNRFTELSGRWMNGQDYAAWIAMRAIGEGITQSKETEVTALYEYLLSEEFQLAGFKGRKLSFRHWNGQLRQPIPLVHSRALVSQSPQQGFLHPVNELDTLGFDRAEVKCEFQSI